MTQLLAKNNSGSMIGWFLGGATLGAAVALLLAPKSGEQARKALTLTAKDGQKSLLQSSQEIFEKGRDLFERGREIAEEAAAALERTRAIAEKKIEDRF